MVGKQFGPQVGAGPCRDLAIFAASVVDGGPITDDMDADADVAQDDSRVAAGNGTFGVFRGDGAVATKEQKGGDAPHNRQHLFDSIDLIADGDIS